MPYAAASRSDAAVVQGASNLAQGIGAGVPDGLKQGHQACGELMGYLRLGGASQGARRTKVRRVTQLCVPGSTTCPAGAMHQSKI
jgi:hypothetical protein